MRLEQKRHLRRGYHCFILMKYEIAWSEKYRPSTLAEIAGNKQAKAALQKWAETWSGREPPEIRAAILSGPPGVSVNAQYQGLWRIERNKTIHDPYIHVNVGEPIFT